MNWSGIKKCGVISYWAWAAFSAFIMIKRYEFPLSLFELALGTLQTAVMLVAVFFLFEEFKSMREITK